MLDSAAGTETSLATLEGASFFFAHAAPDSGILARSNGPSKALIGDRAAIAHQFCRGNLGKGGTGVSYREEKFGVFVAANSFVAPIHD